MAGFLKKPIAPQINKEKAVTPPPVKPMATVKQPAPIKPIAKPTAKSPILPGGGLIKPAPIAAAKKEEPVAKEEVKEEKVTLQPAPANETKEEAPKDKPVIVAKKEEAIKVDEDGKVEIKAEKIEVKEETKEEEVKETKPKKTTRNRKKAEPASTESDFVPEEIPSKSAEEYNDIIASSIIYSAGADWDKQVAELTEMLKAIVIEPDMNTATMKETMSDLVKLKDTIFSEYTLSKTILEAANRKIDVVKGLNAKGSSADERKLNSFKACVEHKEGDLTINLFELLDVATAKFNFYDSLMRQIDFKAKSLITMNGALKLEKDALSI